MQGQVLAPFMAKRGPWKIVESGWEPWKCNDFHLHQTLQSVCKRSLQIELSMIIIYSYRQGCNQGVGPLSPSQEHSPLVPLPQIMNWHFVHFKKFQGLCPWPSCPQYSSALPLDLACGTKVGALDPKPMQLFIIMHHQAVEQATIHFPQA